MKNNLLIWYNQQPKNHGGFKRQLTSNGCLPPCFWGASNPVPPFPFDNLYANFAFAIFLLLFYYALTFDMFMICKIPHYFGSSNYLFYPYT